MPVHAVRAQGWNRSIAPRSLNLGAKWRRVPRPQSLRIHNVEGRMTDEQFLGKDLEGSSHGLLYVIFHIFMNGLSRRVSRLRYKLGLQVQKAATTRSCSAKLSCTTEAHPQVIGSTDINSMHPARFPSHQTTRLRVMNQAVS